jgi:Rod binding domain-containing protein
MELAPLLAKGRAVKMAEQWGAVLATAHARADQDSSPLIPYDFEKETLQKIGNQRGAFATLVRQEALRYAAQVESDYRAFVEALVKPQGAPPAPKPTPQTTPATPVTLGS